MGSKQPGKFVFMCFLLVVGPAGALPGTEAGGEEATLKEGRAGDGE